MVSSEHLWILVTQTSFVWWSYYVDTYHMFKHIQQCVHPSLAKSSLPALFQLSHKFQNAQQFENHVSPPQLFPSMPGSLRFTTGSYTKAIPFQSHSWKQCSFLLWPLTRKLTSKLGPVLLQPGVPEEKVIVVWHLGMFASLEDIKCPFPAVLAIALIGKMVVGQNNSSLQVSSPYTSTMHLPFDLAGPLGKPPQSSTVVETSPSGIVYN